MKKVLAIILAVCMMAVFVPAFAVSADNGETSEVPTYEEALVGKQKLTPYTGEYTLEAYENGDISFGANVGSFNCAFLDGNVFFDRPIAKLLMQDLAMEDVLCYVDGKPAAIALKLHSKVFTTGDGGGFQLAIINAAFTSGQDATVTLVFGNSGLYTEFVVTPDRTTIAVDTSNVVIRGAKATITVTGDAVSAAYKEGETVPVRFHDDHDERTFTVTEVSGNKVVMVCEGFQALKNDNINLTEVDWTSDRGFTVSVNTNLPGGEVATGDNNFAAAYQTKPGQTAGNDMRFLIAAKASLLLANNADVYENANVVLTFKKGDAVVKTFSKSIKDLELFKTVIANGEYWSPAEGDVLTGFIVKDVPAFAWTSWELSVVNGNETLYAGYIEKGIEETVAMGGYVWLQGEQNIHAGSPENPTSGDREGQNEGAWRLFDKTAAKVGVGSGEGNNGTVQVTWNYDAAKTVSLYAIYTGNDSRNNSNRNPLAWTLYGSTDGETYVEIDTVDTPNTPNEGGWGHFYKVDNPTAYQYYKIVFTTNSGAYFQLGELKLYETATSVTYNFNDMIAGVVDKSSNPAPHYAHEGLDQLFDNNSGTKFGYYANTNNVTVIWSYATPQTATGYTITTANDSTYYNRNPEGWKLYGSTDGETWNLLDEVSTSILFSNEFSIFGIDAENQGEYQFYKIEFTVNNHQFQMADIALLN